MTAPITLAPLHSPRIRIDRETDRRITVSGIAVAGAYAAAAFVALALPEALRLGAWLPLHLALAGAASTAISAVLPFFTATLAVAPPAATRLRVGAVVLVAGGAALVVAGHVAATATGSGPANPIATTGALAYLAGMALVTAAAFLPLRGALGPRRRIVELAYAGALLDLGISVGLAALLFAGVPAIAAAWPSIRVGHAWLNLLGFVALVITGTLVHLAPTVAGTQIRPRRSVTIAIAALLPAAPLVALGVWLGTGSVASAGALLGVLGSGAAAAFVAAVVRDRGRWTTEHDWHLAATGHVTAGAAWFAVGMALAGTRVIIEGATVAAWRLDLVVAPLVAGWALQTLVGAWTHLVPPLGGGDPVRHGRRRTILGGFARLRLVTWNVAVAILGVALLLGAVTGPATAIAGVRAADLIGPALGLFAVAGVASIALLARAFLVRD